MKKVGLMILLGVVIGAFAFFIVSVNSAPKFKAINYYLPEDFEGCAVAIYNQEGEKALTISKNREIDYKFDELGVMKTSSPQQFGWEGRKDSGFHKANYFAGETALSANDIHSHNIGEINNPDLGTVEYASITVKVENACEPELVEAILAKNSVN